MKTWCMVIEHYSMSKSSLKHSPEKNVKFYGNNPLLTDFCTKMKFWLVVEVVESSSGRFGAGLLIIVPLLVFQRDLHLHQQRSMLGRSQKSTSFPGSRDTNELMLKKGKGGANCEGERPVCSKSGKIPDIFNPINWRSSCCKGLLLNYAIEQWTWGPFELTCCLLSGLASNDDESFSSTAVEGAVIVKGYFWIMKLNLRNIWINMLPAQWSRI